MKYLLNILLLSFFLNNLSAQEKHFIFIQSDAKQPFYISLNSKLYSSTASGYLIIPKLTDGNYSLTVGFAQNAYPEQTFNLAVQNKDLGFDLKNFNEKGWGLFNLQTLDITMASTANSNVVAKALNTSSNTATPVISFEKKKDVSPAPLATDSNSAPVNLTKVEEIKGAGLKVETSTSVNTETKNVATLAPAVQLAKVAEADGKVAQKADVRKVSEVK
ncbi:MAG: hypothetical protein M3040_18110, partial [Bacteroidota bacterium]|nr:hypothetical protein [Bacteroidota bacterium]